MTTNYRLLNDYLALHGVPLAQSGSSELAIAKCDAFRFLDLMEEHNKFALGIEVWRRNAEKFVIDSLGGWYSDASGLKANIEAAKFFLNKHVLEDEFVTIQFEE